jgi:hypothetical protein
LANSQSESTRPRVHAILRRFATDPTIRVVPTGPVPTDLNDLSGRTFFTRTRVSLAPWLATGRDVTQRLGPAASASFFAAAGTWFFEARYEEG